MMKTYYIYFEEEPKSSRACSAIDCVDALKQARELAFILGFNTSGVSVEVA